MLFKSYINHLGTDDEFAAAKLPCTKSKIVRICNQKHFQATDPY